METDAKFYEQRLWDYNDISVSQNSFVLSSLFSKDEYGINPPRLKFSVNNYKSRQFTFVMVDHSSVFDYLVKAKPVIDSLEKIKQDIKKNNNAKCAFSVDARKTIQTTCMFKPELDVCFRLVISENIGSFYENEKVYIPCANYLSLIKILVDFRDSYFSICLNAQTIISNNSLSEKLDNLNDKLTLLRMDFHSTVNKNIDISKIELIEEEKPKEKLEVVDTNIFLDSNELNGRMETVTIIDELDIDSSTHDNFESFLKNPDFGGKKLAVDTIIERDEEIQVERSNIQVKKSVDDCFTSRFLEGNLLNLETYLTNMISDNLPLDTFINLMARKLEVTKEELFPSCSDKQYWQIVYATTRYTKLNIVKHLNEGVELPQSVAPLRYKCSSSSKLNKSIMYDLFLYFVYYTHLKNQLQNRDKNTTNNKSLACFILKSILSPFIFSHFDSISNVNVLVSEIKNRYRSYENLGVFNKLIEQVQYRYGKDVNVSEASIEQFLRKIHSTVEGNPNKFWIEDFFNTRKQDQYIKFDFKTFDQYEFNKEQITKILALESNHSKNGYVEFGTLNFDQTDIMDLPKDILECFGIKEQSYNTANLKRYIDDVMIDNSYKKQALQIVENINESYHDLVGKTFEFSNLPEDVLKLFCIWDLRTDKKLSQNYNYMKQKIEDSSLDKTTALSILTDINVKNEISFTASLNLSI